MRATVAVLILIVAGCDGPAEQAGEKIDAQQGLTRGEDSIQQGPAERAGEQQDRLAHDEADAREKRADALEDEADLARERARQEADRLDAAARSVRGER